MSFADASPTKEHSDVFRGSYEVPRENAGQWWERRSEHSPTIAAVGGVFQAQAMCMRSFFAYKLCKWICHIRITLQRMQKMHKMQQKVSMHQMAHTIPPILH